MRRRYCVITSLTGLAVLTSVNVHSALAADKLAAAVLNNQAVCLMQRMDFANAVKKLQQSLAINPNYGYALDNLGVAYNNLALVQKVPACLDSLRKAIYINPGQRTTHRNLNAALESINVDPRSFDNRVRLGNACLAKKDNIGAIVEYEEALGLRNDTELATKLSSIPKTPPGSWHNDTTSMEQRKKGIDMAPYMRVLSNKIKSNWYPPTLTEKHRASITFHVNPQGEVSRLKIKQSSQLADFDKAALAAVQHSAPFDKLPAGADPDTDIDFYFDGNKVSERSTFNHELDKLESRFEALFKDKKYSDALVTLQDAIGQAEAISDRGSLAYYFRKQGEYLEVLGKLPEAEAAYKRSIEIEETLPHHSNHPLNDLLQAYRKVLYKNGKTSEAEAIYARIQKDVAASWKN